MKKYFFHFALAAMTALCLTACGSDDDEDVRVDPVNLPVPTNANHAAHYDLAHTLAATSTTVGTIDDARDLKALDITESGKLLIELRKKDGSLSYVMDDCTVNNNIVTVSGSKMKGTVTLQPASLTRATVVMLSISIEVTLPNGETLTYSYGDDTVEATTGNPVSIDQVIDYLCRTWKVTGAILDLKSKKKDIKAYEEFDSNANGYFDLRQVREEALNQNMNLTNKDKEEFNRTVKSVTFTQSGRMVIEYTDHADDVAEWAWADASKSAITIKLNGEDMGNKFI